jgi:hypothetical protein
MTAFVEPGNLADRMLSFRDSSYGSMPTLSRAMIRSIKVRTKHLNHRKKLEAIGTTTARNTFFDCQEFGGKTSVEQYFKKSRSTPPYTFRSRRLTRDSILFQNTK